MSTTELDTTIAGVEATLSALEQAHARQVRAAAPGGGVLYRGTLLGAPDHYRGTLFGPPECRR